MISYAADGVEDKNSSHLLSHTPMYRSGKRCTELSAPYNPPGRVRYLVISPTCDKVIVSSLF